MHEPREVMNTITFQRPKKLSVHAMIRVLLKRTLTTNRVHRCRLRVKSPKTPADVEMCIIYNEESKVM